MGNGKRYPVGRSEKFKHHVIGERANGLVTTLRVGECIFLTLGGETIEIILWGSDSNRNCLCVRSTSKAVHLDRGQERTNEQPPT